MKGPGRSGRRVLVVQILNKQLRGLIKSMSVPTRKSYPLYISIPSVYSLVSTFAKQRIYEYHLHQ